MPCSCVSFSTYLTVMGERTLLTIASTLVRAQEHFFDMFESENNFLIKSDEQSVHL